MRFLHRKVLPIALILAPAGYLLMGGCGLFPNNSYIRSTSDALAPPNTPCKSDFIPNTTYRLQQPVIATAQFPSQILPSIQLIPQLGNPSHGQPLPPYVRDPKYIAATLPAGTNLELKQILIMYNYIGVLEAHPIMSINDPRFPTLHNFDAYLISNVPFTPDPLPVYPVSKQSPAKSSNDIPNIPALYIDPHFLQPLPK